MENLKFRAFVKSLNKVLDVVEIRFLANEIGVGTRHDWHYQDIKDCVLMQSIKEVDKNGVEIFEGDILQGSWNTTFEIVFCNIEKSFKAKDLSNGNLKNFDYFGKMEKLKIIGNSYTGGLCN